MPRKKTNKFQRVIHSLPFLLFLAALVVLVAVSAWNMYQTNQDTKQTVERLEEERQELVDRQNVVADAALDISTRRGLEEEIREKFSVAKEGERVIVLVDNPDRNATSTDQQHTWWQKTLDYIWPW